MQLGHMHQKPEFDKKSILNNYTYKGEEND